MSASRRVISIFNDMPENGGSCSIEHVALNLGKNDYICHVFVYQSIKNADSHQYLKSLKNKGISVYIPNVNAWFARFRFPWLCIRILFLNPDIIHIYRADTAWMLPWLKFFGKPLVYTEATNPNPLLVGEHWYRSLSRCLSFANLVFVPSTQIKNTLIKYHSVNCPIEVVPFAVPYIASDRVKTSPHDRPIRVGTTCRVEELKGIEYLIKAAAIIDQKDNGISFTVWGSGTDRDRLESIVSSYGLEKCFTFAGRYNASDDLDKIMSEIDIFVFPSLLEGMPLSVLEAMSYCKPIICSESSGVSDIVEDTVNGFLTEPKKPTELADRILLLAQSSELRHGVGKLGRISVLEKCSIEQVSKAITIQYKRLTKQKVLNKFYQNFTRRVAQLCGKVFSLMPKFSNPSGLFLFFGNASFGGAEVVHARISQSLGDRKPWIFFSGEMGNLTQYPKSARFVDFSLSSDHPFIREFRLSLYSAVINRHKTASVFGSQSKAYYHLVDRLREEITKSDLIHAFGDDMLNSLQYAHKINNRVVISENLKSLFYEYYLKHNVDLRYHSRIKTIENVVFIPKEPAFKKSNTFNVIFIGRGCDEKRISLVGKLSSQLYAQHKIRIRFIGDVEKWVNAEDRFNCEFLGYIKEIEQMHCLLKEAHAVISLSELEGMPLALLESMAFGVVPVSTEVGAIGDYIEHGKSGLLIRNDSNQLILKAAMKYLTALRDDTDFLASLSQHAYAAVKTRIDEKQFGSSYIELLTLPNKPLPLGTQTGRNQLPISILIYRFNHLGLGETIQSIIQQSDIQFEIRILDDCSNLRLNKNESSYLDLPNVHMKNHERHFGYSSSMKNLMRWSEGEVKLVLRCGDLLHDGSIKEIVKNHSTHSSCPVIQYRPHILKNNKLVEDFSTIIPNSSESLVDIGPVLLTLKASFVDAILEVRSLCEMSLNKELEYKMSLLGRLKYIDKPVSDYHITQDSSFNSPEQFLQAKLSLVKTYFNIHNLDDTSSRLRALILTNAKDTLQLCYKQNKHIDAAPILFWLMRFDALKGIPIALNNLKYFQLTGNYMSGDFESKRVQYYLPRQFDFSDPTLQKNTGRLYDGVILCEKDIDNPGHCIYGLDFINRINTDVVLSIELLIKNMDQQESEVANIDVYDNISGAIVTEKKVLFNDSPLETRNYELDFIASAKHRLEFRVWWYGHCDFTVERIHLREATS